MVSSTHFVIYYSASLACVLRGHNKSSDDFFSAVEFIVYKLTIHRHDWGVDAVASDPVNSQVVYAAVGMYTNSWYATICKLLRS